MFTLITALLYFFFIQISFEETKAYLDIIAFPLCILFTIILELL